MQDLSFHPLLLPQYQKHIANKKQISPQGCHPVTRMWPRRHHTQLFDQCPCLYCLPARFSSDFYQSTIVWKIIFQTTLSTLYLFFLFQGSSFVSFLGSFNYSQIIILVFQMLYTLQSSFNAENHSTSITIPQLFKFIYAHSHCT